MALWLHVHCSATSETQHSWVPFLPISMYGTASADSMHFIIQSQTLQWKLTDHCVTGLLLDLATLAETILLDSRNITKSHHYLV